MVFTKKKIALKKAKQINEEQSQPIAPTVTTQRIEKKKKKRKNCEHHDLKV